MGERGPQQRPPVIGEPLPTAQPGADALGVAPEGLLQVGVAVGEALDDIGQGQRHLVLVQGEQVGEHP